MKNGETERSEQSQFYKVSWTGEGFIHVRQPKQFPNLIVTGVFGS